jgi:subtilisin family serine protease/Tol biopolymer transport system component
MMIIFRRPARWIGFAAVDHRLWQFSPDEPADESRDGERPRRSHSFLAAAVVWLTVLLSSQGVFVSPARAEPPSGSFAPGELLVKFRTSLPERFAPAGLQQSVRRILPGAVQKQEITRDGWQLISLPEGVSVAEAVAMFSEAPEVEYAEPNLRYQLATAVRGAAAALPSPGAAAGELPDDPLSPRLYGLERIGAPEAWRHTTGSRDVVVAVFDSGVDYTHPDLAANMWRNPGEIEGNRRDDDNNGFVDDIHGINVLGNNGDPMDSYGHGTHVVGTIAAVAGNGIGVAGVSPNVQIIAVRVSRDDGAWAGDLIRGLDYLTGLKQRGVNLVAVNHSWGGLSYSRAMAEAFARLSAAGVVNVCAALNFRHDHAVIPIFPGQFNLPGIIAVAATDSEDHLADFSDYNVHTVDVAAPGRSIWSTLPQDGYGAWSGTSMATPHVAGAVALLYSLRPDITPEQVKNLLMSTADPLPAFDRDRVRSGRINVGRAAQWLTEGKPLPDSFRRPEVPHLNVTSISRTPDGFDANGASSAPVLSHDGRWVAFVSSATNLISGDNNRQPDIFLHDRTSGATVRVSQTSDGTGANGASSSPAVSGNGDWVAFTSNARNLAAKGDVNQQDVLLWSRLTGEIEWISRPATESPGGASFHAGVDFSGRWVIFQSNRALLDRDGNGQADIYLRDRQTGELVLVSATPDGRAGSGASSAPVISADGRWAAFVSQAENLVPGLALPAAGIFVRDLSTGATELASVDSTGGTAAQASSRPRISADGRFVAFQTGTNLDEMPSPAGQHVYLRDRSSGRTVRASKTPDGRPVGGNSVLEGMSADGRWVLFRSSSQLLPPGTGSIVTRLFAYDRLADDVVALSYSDAGEPSNLVPGWVAGNDPGVTDGVFSGDGFHVAYSTVAWNLTPGDGNMLADVFAYDRRSSSLDLTVRPDDSSTETGRGLIGANLQQYLARALKEGEAGAGFEVRLINRGGASEGPLVRVELGAAAASFAWPPGTSPLATDLWKLPACGPGESLAWSVYLPVPVANSSAMVRLAAGEIGEDGLFVAGDRITASVTVPLKPGGTELVSVAGDGSPLQRHAGRAWFYPENKSGPSISADGRFVVFDSFADNVISADRNEIMDVFLRDRLAGTNRAVSAAAQLGNDLSLGGRISGDGRFVVFTSYASNLGPDNNFTGDVFLKNLETGAIDVLSRRGNIHGSSNSTWGDSAISADGRWVAFSSYAGNLVSGDTNRVMDIFLWGPGATAPVMISRSPEGTPGNSGSLHPVISSNGRWVGYSSYADNLTAAPKANRFRDAFLWDAESGETELLSRNAEGRAANGQSEVITISDNGRWVVLVSDAHDLPGISVVNSGYYLLDRQAWQFHPAEQWLGESGWQVTNFSMTADGEWLFLGMRRRSGAEGMERLETRVEVVRRAGGPRQVIATGMRGPGAPVDGFQEVQFRYATSDGRFILFHGEGREGRPFVSQVYLFDRGETGQPGTEELRIVSARLVDGALRLTISGEGHRPYTVQQSTDLRTWSNLQTVTPASSNPFEWSAADTQGERNRFFRVKTP